MGVPQEPGRARWFREEVTVWGSQYLVPALPGCAAAVRGAKEAALQR